MRPDIWGPPAWTLLHAITLDYPNNPTNEDKQNMLNFIISLGKVLPCAKCRLNFRDHLLKYPLDNEALSSKNNLVNWMIDIHNCVNESKNQNKLTYEEGLSKILEPYNNISESRINYMYIALVFLFIILVILGYMFLQ